MNNNDNLMLLIFFLPSLIALPIFTACSPGHISNNDFKLQANQSETVQHTTKQNEVLDQSKLNQLVTIHGIAENAKLGAVIAIDDDNAIYIEGLSEWETQVLNQKIVVTGMLRRKKLAPDPLLNPKGEVSQGLWGDSLVLENANWKVEKNP